jgi:hypothetical protein
MCFKLWARQSHANVFNTIWKHLNTYVHLTKAQRHNATVLLASIYIYPVLKNPHDTIRFIEAHG